VPALLALMRWGDRWGWQDGPRSPVRVVHAGCGGTVEVQMRCESCGQQIVPRDVVALLGDPVPHPPAASQPGRLSAERLQAAPGGVRLAS
jgi:hypothetical protein